MFDAASGDLLRQFHFTAEVVASIFVGDTTVVLPSSDGRVRGYGVVLLGEGGANVEGHKCPIRSVSISCDLRRVVSAASNGDAHVWDVSSGSLVAVVPLNAPLRFVQFSPVEPNIFAAACDDALIRLTDVALSRCVATMHGHTLSVRVCRFGPGGTQFVSASVDKSVRLWDAQAPYACRMVLLGHTDTVLDAELAPSAPLVASSSADKTVRMWDITSGKVAWVGKGHSAYVYRCAFSPDGRRLVTASGDRSLRLWNVAKGTVLHVCIASSSLLTAAFSPDGRRVAACGYDSRVGIWEVSSGAAVRETKSRAGTEAKSLAFSSDSTTLFVVDTDGLVRVMDAKTGSIIGVHKAQGGFQAMEAVTIDRTATVVCGSSSGTVESLRLRGVMIGADEMGIDGAPGTPVM